MSDAVRATFRRPFSEQVSAFRLRMLNLAPSQRWDDLFQAEHDRGFMVAGAMKADLLADLAAAVEKSIREGTGLEEFRRDWSEIIQRRNWHGWTGEGSKRGEAWRTKIVYMTNMRTSYAAGRWAQIVSAGYKYVIYKHGNSLDPREQHLAWDGLILPIDHPFWVTHGPPNGWGCSCYVLGARSIEHAVALGGKPNKTLPENWQAINPKTGAPVGIDKGWAYTPGRSVAETLKAITPKLVDLPAPIGADWINEWPDRLFKTWSDAFGEFVDMSLNSLPQQRSFVVGALKPDWVRASQEAGVAPKTAEILASDVGIRHAFRSAKGNTVDLEWFKRLPEWLRRPDIVMLDPRADKPGADATFYLFINQSGNANSRIVIKLNYDLRRVGETNFVITTMTGKDNDPKSFLGWGYILVSGEV